MEDPAVVVLNGLVFDPRILRVEVPHFGGKGEEPVEAAGWAARWCDEIGKIRQWARNLPTEEKDRLSRWIDVYLSVIEADFDRYCQGESDFEWVCEGRDRIESLAALRSLAGVGDSVHRAIFLFDCKVSDKTKLPIESWWVR